MAHRPSRSQALAALVLGALLIGALLIGASLAQRPPELDELDRLRRENSALHAQRGALAARVKQLEASSALEPAGLVIVEEELTRARCPTCASGLLASSEEESAPQHAPAASSDEVLPDSAEGWLALLQGAGRDDLPHAFEIWLCDPAHLGELALAVRDLEDPALQALLLEEIGLRRRAIHSDVQRAARELLAHPNADVRGGALFVLAQALTGDPLFEGRLDPVERLRLVEMARSGEIMVRYRAIVVLSNMSPFAESTQLFTEVVADPGLPAAARTRALEALRNAPLEIARPAFFAALDQTQPVGVRQAAAEGLTFTSPERATEEFFTRLGPALEAELDGVTKHFLILALVQADRPRTVRLLRSLEASASDPWEARRYAALAGVIAAEGNYERVRDGIVLAVRRVNAQQQEASAGQ
jgi:hypothetical protein